MTMTETQGAHRRSGGPQAGRRGLTVVLRPGLWLLAASALVGATARPAETPGAAQTPPDIHWPTPSQPPGSVTFTSRYPTETAWDPVLAQFARDRGSAFQEMTEAAQRFAASTGRAPKADLATARRWGMGTPSEAKLLRLVDIVRLPVLPVADMAPLLERVGDQLGALRKGGFDRAVWEVTDLPEEGALAEWSDACLKVFPRPPVLMLGWRLDNGRIAPAPDVTMRFIERCAPRCHSVMLTGEELNTQFYRAADGGLAVPFLRYWVGVLRSRAPRAFVWCRVDEMVASQRPNGRQETWTRELLPLCDGLAYQVHHGAQDVQGPRRISEQFQKVEHVVSELSRDGSHPPRQDNDAHWPVLLGGFVTMRAAAPGIPGFGVDRMAAELKAYEGWLAAEGIAGYIRYVGMLPAAPAPELVGCSLPGVAAAAVSAEDRSSGSGASAKP